MMKRLILLALGVSLPWVSTIAPAQTEAKPAGDLAARVDKVFEKWNRTDSPGCALSVMKDGRIVYRRDYGMANLDHNVAITPSTVFHVASVSKQFVAAAIVLLAQQGKLTLDDDVRRHIPELPDFGAPITLRHLIHHTSGLRDQWELLELAGWRYSLDLITDEDVLSVVVRQKELNFKPGERYSYCNTGYTLLAIVVKRASGLSFREFTSRSIFEPLGMTSTHFRDDHAEIVKNNAYGYRREKEGPFRLSLTNFDTAGATSLHTTVEDLALWDENFYHPRVGGASFPAEMLQRGRLNNGETLDYAFGLEPGKYKGLDVVGHSGSDAGYRADLMRFPGQHASFAVLCNSADTSPTSLIREVADIYLAQDMSRVERSGVAAAAGDPTGITLDDQQLARFAGLYWKRDDDQFAKAYVKEGTLRAWLGGGGEFALKPVGAADFRLAGVPFGNLVSLRFEPGPGGQAGRLLIRYGDEKPGSYEAVPSSAQVMAEPGEYAGTYVSEEIEPVYRMSVQEGRLVLGRLKHGPDVLEPRMRDVFSGNIGTIRFVRDSRHRVSGLLVSTAGVRHLRFTRRPG